MSDYVGIVGGDARPSEHLGIFRPEPGCWSPGVSVPLSAYQMPDEYNVPVAACQVVRGRYSRRRRVVGSAQSTIQYGTRDLRPRGVDRLIASGD